MWSLVLKTVDGSPAALGSSAPRSLGALKAKSSNWDLTGTGKLVARDSNENTASSSQMRQSDVNSSSSAGKPTVETTKNPMSTRLSHHNLTISQNYVILRKSARTFDKNLVVNKETICLRSTSTRWSGEYSCPRQWRRRYIFDKSIKIIYTPPRTQTSRKSIVRYFTEFDPRSKSRSFQNICTTSSTTSSTSLTTSTTRKLLQRSFRMNPST